MESAPNHHPTLRSWLGERPFSLALSSGYFGFYAHTGVLAALEEADLRPKRISGASAGALVAGCFAAGMSADQIRDALFRVRREDFWDPAPGLGLLKGRLFEERLRDVLPIQRIENCDVPISVSAYDVLARRGRVIDTGQLATAIHASCALPGLFQPVFRGGRPFIDGGVIDRPGIAGVPGEDRVLCHHLLPVGPWRKGLGFSAPIPRRRGLTALTVGYLPRVGPFHLDQGKRAFERAYRATRNALNLPVIDAVVRSYFD